MSLDSVFQTRAERPDGLILAGGAGRRLDGRDKGLMPYKGRAAAEVALETLSLHCERVFVSANRNLEIYRAMQTDGVVRDRRPGYAGPLAGLEALHTVGVGQTLLMLPCDTPEVAPGVFVRLLGALQENPELEVSFARSAHGSHYLVAAVRRPALTGIPALLDQGERAVRTWLEGVRSESLYFEGAEADSLINRNTISDWEKHEGPS